MPVSHIFHASNKNTGWIPIPPTWFCHTEYEMLTVPKIPCWARVVNSSINCTSAQMPLEWFLALLWNVWTYGQKRSISCHLFTHINIVGTHHRCTELKAHFPPCTIYLKYNPWLSVSTLELLPDGCLVCFFFNPAVSEIQQCQRPPLR